MEGGSTILNMVSREGFTEKDIFKQRPGSGENYREREEDARNIPRADGTSVPGVETQGGEQ